MAGNESITLQAKGIKKSFSTRLKELKVLEGVDLEVPQGKLVSIIGASGVGKSTLLHILGGLDSPDSGQVFLDSTNLLELRDRQLSEFRNRSIGFVFQFHHLLSEFTATENVMMPMLINRQDKHKSKQKAYHILEQVGLADKAEQKPPELSGGEQQRLAVARALANQPRLVLADEPTGNLDRKSSLELLELFMRLKSEKQLTFVLATHNLEIAGKSDRIYELKEGRAALKKAEES
ncbi:MAG: ABC transporter ATP-binding protein [candidate division Zixibacteria bacterium]|nr:ABC transporter ATP-binding protein [candidate division Zixibacteria bacterium]